MGRFSGKKIFFRLFNGYPRWVHPFLVERTDRGRPCAVFCQTTPSLHRRIFCRRFRRFPPLGANSTGRKISPRIRPSFTHRESFEHLDQRGRVESKARKTFSTPCPLPEILLRMFWRKCPKFFLEGLRIFRLVDKPRPILR